MIGLRKKPLVSADVRGGGMRDEPKERLRRRLSARAMLISIKQNRQ